MRLLIMFDGEVGNGVVDWLLMNFPDDVSVLVAIRNSAELENAKKRGIPCVIFKSEQQILLALEKYGEFDIGILLWWPKVISQNLISRTSRGFINTHPSYLPYCRGKNYNFWTLIEEAPFGVSLHFVTQKVDAGNVIAQRKVPYSWEDNGETLYEKAQKEMYKLFVDTYPKLRKGIPQGFVQDLAQGSFHYQHEMEIMSRIDLDGSYIARDLLNIIRARTFFGHPAAFFLEGDETFEVTVSIKKSPDRMVVPSNHRGKSASNTEF